MKIKQVITSDTTVYIFTEEIEKDFLTLKAEYENQDEVEPSFPLGFEEPLLTEYTFLGGKYKCISIWFDNERCTRFFLKSKD